MAKTLSYSILAAFICLLSDCILIAADQPIQEASSNKGVLHWNNGDMLKGTLLGYEDDYLHFQSDQFGAVVEVHSDFIASLDFKTPIAPVKPKGDFRIETVTGDVFFGALKAIDDQHVDLLSDRSGELKLRREFVREIRQLKHTQVLYDGPRWLDGWKVLKAGRMVSEWNATEHGYLHTKKYGGELFHELPVSDVAEINIVLSWSDKPGFQLDFATPKELVATRPRPRLSIKSWGDDVVAQSAMAATDFQHLLKLADRQKELRLRLLWDNKAGEIAIMGDGGTKLGRVIVKKNQPTEGFGILIKNRSDDLTLEQIRVSKWNGASKSEDQLAGKSYVRLASGKLTPWTELKFDAGSTSLALEDGKTVELSDMAIAEFVPTGSAGFQSHHIRFADGTEFSCKLTAISETYLEAVVPSAFGTLRVKRDNIESLRSFQGRTNEFDFHLVGSGSRLSGNLRPISESDALGWSPIGARKPVPIRVGVDQTIERRMGQVAGPRMHSGTEVVYLRDDSLLIGDVKTIDEKELVFVTPYSTEQAIPLGEVRAVEMLKGAGRVNFASPDWEFMREARPVQRSQEYLEVADPISMRDLGLSHDGKVSFHCSWDEDFVGLLTIHLGTADKQPRNSIARFTFSRDRLSARCLVDSVASRTLPTIPNRRASISLEADDDRLTVWVNGIMAFKAKTKRKIEGQGIWLQCGSAQGPMANKTGRKAVMTIERLRIGQNASRLGAGFASDEELEMVLKLPRNLAQDAPKTVMCSNNGDLLRGELQSLDSDTIKFASKYEKIAMPRSEVSALVWLHEDETVNPGNNSLRMTLRNGSVIHLQNAKVDDETMVGEHSLVKACTIPLREVLKIQNSASEWASLGSMVKWKLEPTPEPKFVDADDGGLDSSLVGVDVSSVEIPLLNDDVFRIGDHTDTVIVLDFWASWCAPCIRSLPKMVNLERSYSDGKVKLLAVNQEETKFTINEFLANRNLDMTVGLDTDLSLSRKFLVGTLPQTVLIGRTGKVERVFIGTPTDLHKTLQTAINDLLPPTD